MIFNPHYHLEGQHAYLGASKYAWTNYDEEKLVAAYLRHQATLMGTKLHEFASMAIKLRIRLPKTKETLNMFINDAIGFKMKSEQPLFYSINSFGTADAISFRNDTLRIHDLKTGVSPTSMRQLEVYAALFCLEYFINPKDIKIELRIYQNDTVLIHNPSVTTISDIMTKIKVFDKRIEELKQEV